MADFRNDDLEDILAGMLDEQDRRNGRQSSAAKPPELPRRGDAPAAPAAPVPGSRRCWATSSFTAIASCAIYSCGPTPSRPRNSAKG